MRLVSPILFKSFIFSSLVFSGDLQKPSKKMVPVTAGPSIYRMTRPTKNVYRLFDKWMVEFRSPSVTSSSAMRGLFLALNMTLSSVVKKHEAIMKLFSIFVKDAGS